MMKRYFFRAVKYFIWLVVLFVAVFALMLATGTSRVGFAQGMEILFDSRQGWFLVTVILVLSATYPSFGFVKRYYRLSFDEFQDKVMRAFEMSGFYLASSDGNTMVFRSTKGIKNAAMLFEPITVSHNGSYIVMEGNRRELVKIDYRFRSFLE